MSSSKLNFPWSWILPKASVNNGDEETQMLNQSAILRSPGRLYSLDYKEVRDWLKASKYFHLLGIPIHTDAVEMKTSEKTFTILVKVAFNALFPQFRNDTDPETMLLYYTGNAISTREVDEMRSEKSNASPNLLSFGISKKMLEPAAMYIEPKRRLEGGELDLGEFGYCDLGGILEPWITALTRSPTPKNKHLIVIVDSICSGRFVEDLQKLASEEGPWNQNDCSVTVQSACSRNQVNFVGRFTPCLVYFNKPENRISLQVLKRKWNRKNEKVKNMYRKLNLPSPQLATTMPLTSQNTNSPTLEFHHIRDRHGKPLTLFRDVGFFKFCYLNHLEIIGTNVPGTPMLKQFILFIAEILESKWEILVVGGRMLSAWYRLAVFIIGIFLRLYRSLVEIIEDLSKWF